MDAYLSADTHFGHKNILIYEPSRQQFGDVPQMDERLIERWNDTVKPNDLVFHIGDVFFSKIRRAEEIAKRLHGRKILIKGNHDYFSRKKYYEMGFDMYQYYYYQGLFLSHYPQDDSAIRSAINHGAIIGNVHGHVHSDLTGLDQDIYKCVSTELTDFKPLHIDEVYKHFQRRLLK